MVVGFRQKSVPWCTVKVIEGGEILGRLIQEEEYGKFGVTTLKKLGTRWVLARVI